MWMYKMVYLNDRKNILAGIVAPVEEYSLWQKSLHSSPFQSYGGNGTNTQIDNKWSSQLMVILGVFGVILAYMRNPKQSEQSGQSKPMRAIRAI